MNISKNTGKNIFAYISKDFYTYIIAKIKKNINIFTKNLMRSCI